ncbi:MAG: hypothetical protein KAQ75_08710, partial [Bacteroidales bacterium]|nr:hypothetical protein [Bacteroidales bacterium]
DDQVARDLFSASNTKMVFDGNLELDGSRIEAKHLLHKQDNELFDKYISEQIKEIAEVITQNNDLQDDILRSIQDDIFAHTVKISENDKISISERMQLLDTFFHEQKKEYAIKKIGNNFNPESCIEEIIKRSEKDVDTGNQEADARFRNTLRNTLYFKARHLISADQDPNSISISLNEEYAKHRSFYTKNM